MTQMHSWVSLCWYKIWSFILFFIGESLVIDTATLFFHVLSYSTTSQIRLVYMLTDLLIKAGEKKKHFGSVCSYSTYKQYLVSETLLGKKSSRIRDIDSNLTWKKIWINYFHFKMSVLLPHRVRYRFPLIVVLKLGKSLVGTPSFVLPFSQHILQAGQRFDPETR